MVNIAVMGRGIVVQQECKILGAHGGQALQGASGIDFLHVSYKGGGSTFPDLLAGRSQ
jgi:hypothetical protein